MLSKTPQLASAFKLPAAQSPVNILESSFSHVLDGLDLHPTHRCSVQVACHLAKHEYERCQQLVDPSISQKLGRWQSSWLPCTPTQSANSSARTGACACTAVDRCGWSSGQPAALLSPILLTYACPVEASPCAAEWAVWCLCAQAKPLGVTSLTCTNIHGCP